MALDIKSGSALGCSYYTYEAAELYVLEDVAMAEEDAVDALILQIQPNTIIVPTRAPGWLLKALDRWRTSKGPEQTV
jgi:hypothetical protein